MIAVPKRIGFGGKDSFDDETTRGVSFWIPFHYVGGIHSMGGSVVGPLPNPGEHKAKVVRFGA